MGEQTSPPAVIRIDKQAERLRKTRLLNIMTISGIVGCLAFLIPLYALSPSPVFIYALAFWGMLACCVASWALNRAGRVGAASVLYTCSLTLIIFAIIMARVLDGVLGPAVYYFLVPVLVAGMVVGPRATLGFATLNVGLIAILTVLARRVLPYAPILWKEEVLVIVIPAGILCYVMAIVGWLYGRSLEGTLRQMAEQSQQLQLANEAIRAFSRVLEEKVEERTQELRDFVSMVAHDLRNPLTVINGYTTLLLEGQAEGEDNRQSRHIGMLASNVKHMLELTDDLLEISRLRAGSIAYDMEALPIELIIEEVCAIFEPQLVAKRLGLKVELSPDLVPVWGDHLRLTQVLRNLVGNACNYTPAGAIIVGARRVNGLIEVSVSDTGIGISREDQRRLFGQFFRGEHQVVRSTKGTGLGLAISRDIVEAHGGQIWVESEVDHGSTFRFTVPVAPNPPSDGAVIAAPQPEPSAAMPSVAA